MICASLVWLVNSESLISSISRETASARWAKSNRGLGESEKQKHDPWSSMTLINTELYFKNTKCDGENNWNQDNLTNFVILSRLRFNAKSLIENTIYF